MKKITPEFLRETIIGVDAPFCTPFGERLITYCDYTASGRTLLFIEKYLMRLQRNYANTHTEDDMTGRSMTFLLEEAEQQIKQAVGANQDDRIICTGTGATGAITKLQQILGTYLPPATRAQIEASADCDLDKIKAQAPVIFLGPYEHHSNEISWRDGLCEVIELDLNEDGHADIKQLEALLWCVALRNPIENRVVPHERGNRLFSHGLLVTDAARVHHTKKLLSCQFQLLLTKHTYVKQQTGFV